MLTKLGLNKTPAQKLKNFTRKEEYIKKDMYCSGCHSICYYETNHTKCNRPRTTVDGKNHLCGPQYCQQCRQCRAHVRGVFITTQVM
jgi:hypothetical protein